MFDALSYLRAQHPRIRTLGLVVGLLLVLFVLRLFYIQVVQHGYYSELARNFQVTKQTIFPERGMVYARDGASGLAPLAINETVYTVFADPQEVSDPDKISGVLRRVAGGEVIDSSFGLLKDSSRRYVVLARQVTRTQAELIKKEELAGVGLQKGSRRTYPEQALAAQLLGYVNNEGVGQYGLEGSLNDRLTGKTGLLQSVTDVRRIPLTIGDDNIERPAVNGENLVLSVDRNVQFQLEQLLQHHAQKVKAPTASAIIMNPNNGQIVAMANTPTYDPAKFSEVGDYNVFQNRVTANAYEAGSVIKTLTVAAGLDAGTITPTSTTPNPNGCITVEGSVICNVIRNGITNPTTQQLLTYSFNTGAVGVVRSLGGGTLNKTARDTFYDYLTSRFRFGVPTGVEQAGEAAGTVISPDEAEGNSVRYANMSFGQGMTVTMTQVAAAFSACINGGTYYKPTLVYGLKNSDGSVKTFAPTVVNERTITPEHSAEMRELVWHTRYDSSVSRAVDPAGYKIGGKTGTSQTIDPKTGQYTSDRTIGSYLGFVGGAAPQYVIMIRMDFAEGGTFAGSIEANTMFGEMARWLIAYEGIQQN